MICAGVTRIGALKILDEAKEQVDGIPITFLGIDTEASVGDYLLEQETADEWSQQT
ncbi:MAG: hypothetical protein ABSF77_11775 [Spirochaetia bacterium]